MNKETKRWIKWEGNYLRQAENFYKPKNTMTSWTSAKGVIKENEYYS